MITDVNATFRRHRGTLEAIKILREIRMAKDKRVERKNNSGRKPKYPWASLEVRQSFLVLCADKVARDRAMDSLSSCICNIRAKTGMHFTQRTAPQGIRVWRTL